MNRPCECGHLESQHGYWDGSNLGVYIKACLLKEEGKYGFECPTCFTFKPDNLKYLENEYSKTL